MFPDQKNQQEPEQHGFKSIIKKKYKLWYRVKSSKSSLVKEEYIIVCKELRQKIRSSKIVHQKIATNWKYITGQKEMSLQIRQESSKRK